MNSCPTPHPFDSYKSILREEKGRGSVDKEDLRVGESRTSTRKSSMSRSMDWKIRNKSRASSEWIRNKMRSSLHSPQTRTESWGQSVRQMIILSSLSVILVLKISMLVLTFKLFLFVLQPLTIEEPLSQIFSIFESILHRFRVKHNYDKSSAFHLNAASQTGTRWGCDSGLDADV